MRKIKRVAYISELKPLNLFESQYKRTSTKGHFMQFAGDNTGNYLFYNAINNFFQTDIFSYRELSNELIDEYDIFVCCDEFIWIREDTDLSNYVLDIINRVHAHSKILLPLCVGVQTHWYKSEYSFSHLTLKALYELSERIELPCRGYYTAEMLNKAGIKNTVPVGCPSLYSGMNPSFQLQKAARLGGEPKISVNITPFIHERSSWSSFAYIIYLAEHYNALCVGQAPNEVYHLMNMFREDADVNRRIYEKIIKNYRYFYDISSWHQAISQYNFSLGNRFHGNVMSVISGVPALFLLSDSRVQEMCEFFSLPAVDMNVMERNPHIEELYGMANYSSFNKKFRERYENFEGFLLRNDLIEKARPDIELPQSKNTTVLQRFAKITILIGGSGAFLEAVADKLVKAGYQQKIQLLAVRENSLFEIEAYNEKHLNITYMQAQMHDLSGFLTELCSLMRGRYFYFLWEPTSFSHIDIDLLTNAIARFEFDIMIWEYNSLPAGLMEINRMFGHDCRRLMASYIPNNLIFSNLSGKLISRALLKRVWSMLKSNKHLKADTDSEPILPLLLCLNANRVLIRNPESNTDAIAVNINKKDSEKKMLKLTGQIVTFLSNEMPRYMDKASMNQYFKMYEKHVGSKQ